MKYDKELSQAVWKYKKNNGITVDDLITPRLVASLNVPMADRIKSIIFNMERCRWISSDFNQAKEYIFINIPSYEMNYFKEGKTLLNSKVVVGKVMNQTVIFSGMLQYVVFSPYWNVPKSIIDKEIAPVMKKNKNYLAQHNMEWNDGNIRQKPGPKNSLGLVKFLFPNSNSIYLHDTPSKSLFKEEKRAFSHGCIRLEKPIELAYLLVKDDKSWTMEKLNNAFHSKKEIWYTLKHKIPVYIGYFTAWVNENDEVQFYDDVYARDECLTTYLFNEQ
jgi:murein L,D-transpeptidase YcbB/YkuD